MTKIVCLLGSPRRDGNSDRLAARFCVSAEQRGASVESFALAELSYSGCKNLFRCKSDLEHCGQVDDLTPVLQAVAEAEVLVLASPVYFTGVSGQLKSAIDRFFSFLVPDYPNQEIKSRLSPGRSLVLIQTQGEPEDRYADLLVRHSAGFRTLGYDRLHLIRAWGVREPDDVERHPDFLERCDYVAEAVLSDG